MTEETTQALAPAPAAIDEAAPATAPETVTSPPDDAGIEPERKHWSQRRIDELTRNWRESERREQALLEMLRDRQQPTPEPPKPAEPARMPTLADFEYDEGRFQAALFDLADKRVDAAVDARLAERERAGTQQRREANFIRQIQEVAGKHDDFDVMNIRSAARFPVNEAMREVMMDSDLGGELLYWIGQNTDAARKISEMSPYASAAALGIVEHQLRAAKTAPPPAPPPVPSVTQAPPPPPVVPEAEEADSGPERDPTKMSDAEFAKWRKRQIAQRR